MRINLEQLSITGASDLSADGEIIVESALRKLPRAPDEFTTGGAFGVDTFAAEFGFQLFRRRTSIFRLCYPEGKLYNPATRRYANLIIPVTGGYMKRNDMLVYYCTTLAAFPPDEEEIAWKGPGSGTWATVRRGRKAGRQIIVFPLNGSTPWYESPLSPGIKQFLSRG